MAANKVCEVYKCMWTNLITKRTCEIVAEGFGPVRGLKHERVVVFYAVTPVSEATFAGPSVLSGIAIDFQAR